MWQHERRKANDRAQCVKENVCVPLIRGNAPACAGRAKPVQRTPTATHALGLSSWCWEMVRGSVKVARTDSAQCCLDMANRTLFTMSRYKCHFLTCHSVCFCVHFYELPRCQIFGANSEITRLLTAVSVPRRKKARAPPFDTKAEYQWAACGHANTHLINSSHNCGLT